MRHTAMGAILAALATIILLALFWRHGPQGDAGIQHWIAVHTGTDQPGATPAQRSLNYWSGFGSVIPWSLGILAGVLGGIGAYWRHHNCHDPGCPLLGRYPDAGGQFTYCGKHHPGWQGNRPARVHMHEAHHLHVAHQRAVIELARAQSVDEQPPVE